jgi:hypothetical protein
VEQYGPAFVYFFDEGAFVEQPGFWVRGAAGTRVAAMSIQPGEPLQLFIRNAPVKNLVSLDIDDQVQTLELQPREERHVPIPSASGRRASLITIRTDSGFRPSQVEPGSTDNRYLGVWVEVRK